MPHREKPVALTYRYWYGKRQRGKWMNARLFFDTPEDAEEYVTDKGDAIDSYIIQDGRNV